MKGMKKKLQVLVVALASVLCASNSSALSQTWYYGSYGSMFATIISSINFSVAEAYWLPYWQRHSHILCNNETEDTISPSGSSPPALPFVAYITLQNPGQTYCYMTDYYMMYYPGDSGILDTGSVSEVSIISKL